MPPEEKTNEVPTTKNQAEELNQVIVELRDLIDDKDQAIAVLQAEIKKLQEQPTPAPSTTSAIPQQIRFTEEDHLMVAIELLEKKQQGQMNCPEYREALVSANQALTWLQTRERCRSEQGVIDADKPHVSPIR